ncbi:hypothetical protein U1Q18_014632, partial [Sarracenia purpurea var. burkii]
MPAPSSMAPSPTSTTASHDAPPSSRLFHRCQYLCEPSPTAQICALQGPPNHQCLSHPSTTSVARHNAVIGVTPASKFRPAF